MENIDDIPYTSRRFFYLRGECHTSHGCGLHLEPNQRLGVIISLKEDLSGGHRYLYSHSTHMIINIKFDENTNLWQTWGSRRRIPEVCMSSQPRIRKSISLSSLSPSAIDGVKHILSLGKIQFSRLITTLLNLGFGFSLMFLSINSLFIKLLLKLLIDIFDAIFQVMIKRFKHLVSMPFVLRFTSQCIRYYCYQLCQ